MEKNKVINSVYLLPAIIEKLKGNNNKNIDRILNEFNVNPGDYKNIQSLLKYHIEIIKTDFNADYPLLRKGLTEYFNEYLKDFWIKLGIVDTSFTLLDYGCGDGIYSDQFEASNSRGKTIKVDKQYGIDFIKDPEWFYNIENTCDLVLLSEILHCKGLDIQEYLIESSISCLNKSGRIIINENIDPFMGWRLNKLTTEGDILTETDIVSLMSKYDVKLIGLETINYHKIYVYEKF